MCIFKATHRTKVCICQHRMVCTDRIIARFLCQNKLSLDPVGHLLLSTWIVLFQHQTKMTRHAISTCVSLCRLLIGQRWNRIFGRRRRYDFDRLTGDGRRWWGNSGAVGQMSVRLLWTGLTARTRTSCCYRLTLLLRSTKHRYLLPAHKQDTPSLWSSEMAT